MSDKKKTTEARSPGSQLLIDTMPIKLQIVEGDDEKQMKVRGEFGRAGLKTENNRVYPHKLIERELGRLSTSLKDRKVLGELDHPADGKTQLNRVSHLITDLRLENNVVVGEAEPLDTEKGKTLQALLKSGVKLGVSSRGFGSVKTNDKGEDIVQEDFKLLTYDFVAEPADQQAYPDVVYEEDEHMPEDLSKLTVEELREKAPSLVEQLEKAREDELAAEWAKKLEAAKNEAGESSRMSLKEEFTKELVAAVGKTKSEIRESVRDEFLADPEVAAAKVVVEQLKDLLRPFVLPEDAEAVAKAKDEEIAALQKTISEKDEEISGLKDEVRKLADVAKEVGYKYYLERLIGEDDDADLVRKLVGDVKKYENSEAIQGKVEAIRAELAQKAQKVAATEEETEKLRGKVDRLTEALDKSMQANEEMKTLLHAEQQLKNHPRAERIRRILESAKPRSQEDVDEVIENFREPDRDPSELEAVRARVRRYTRGGRGPTAEEEEEPKKKPRAVLEESNYNQLGASLGELQQLAGIRPKN
jgi:hypothetical protein